MIVNGHVYISKGEMGFLMKTCFFWGDERHIGPTEILSWEASIRWGSALSWLGIHDASINVQPLPQELGPWAGMVTNTQEGVHGLVLQ